MNRLFRIILISILIVGLWGTARVQNRMVELESRIQDKLLNLSVLDSCGIITNGMGGGSCVAIAPDLILTAGHCIDIPDTWIEIQDIQYKIIEKWKSENSDVGFVRIEGQVPFLELGCIPKILDKVYLIGSPYSKELKNTITEGIISGLNRNILDRIGLTQADAEGAPGSSGGPLLNEEGRIIGICVTGPVPGGGVTLCESVDSIRLALEEYNAFCIGKTKELPLGQ